MDNRKTSNDFGEVCPMLERKIPGFHEERDFSTKEISFF